MTRTHSLEDAARQICGDSLKNPALWLRRRIREGKVQAVRVGHTVRLTDQQILDAIEALTIGGTKVPEVPAEAPVRLGVTPASLRRRSA